MDKLYAINHLSEESSTHIGLFRYQRSGENNDNMSFKPSTDMTLTNSSWSPSKIEIDEIIVISRWSPVPLVLRKLGDSYLFVGACCLIDSELRGSTKEHGAFGADPGILSIMHGSAWDETRIEDSNVD
jgi:hypothetical protein